MTVTYNAGSDTVSLSSSFASPDTLDAIVAAVANTAKARKEGGYTYIFNFAELAGSGGFIDFAADTLTIFNSCLWTRYGGGAIFRNRSIVRFEGNGFYASGTATTGHTVYAYRDTQGVNPRLILASTVRYDFFTAHDWPGPNLLNYQITGLDIETIGYNAGNGGGTGVSASIKIYPSLSSSISNLRLLVRNTGAPAELQFSNGTYQNFSVENAAISTAAEPTTLTMPDTSFNFLGASSPLTFNFNSTNSTINLIDPVFPNGSWNGNYSGISGGFRNSATCVANVYFTDTASFLQGSTGRQMRVVYTRSDAAAIEVTTTSGGAITKQQLLRSFRNGSGFTTGTTSPNATYTWSAVGRAYDYKIGASTDVLFSALALSAARNVIYQVVPVPYLTLTESQANSLTGISHSASGATGGTATISSNRTIAELWQRYRWWVSQFSNFGSNDTWSYDGSRLNLGAWNLTINSGIALSSGTIATSGVVTLSSAGNYSALQGIITGSGSISLTAGGAYNLQGWTGSTTTISASAPAVVTVDALGEWVTGANVIIQEPLVQVTLEVTGAPLGASIAVFVRSSSKVANTSQFTLASGNNSGNSTLVVSSSIPADVPSSGFVRVIRNDGFTEDRLAYSSYSGSIFTLSGTLPATYSAGNGCYVGYLDVLSSATGAETKTFTFVENRNCVLVVRKGSGVGKIEDIRQDFTLTSSGGVISVSGNLDSINTS